MEANLAELRELGYTVVQGVIPGDALVALRGIMSSEEVLAT